MNEDNNKKQPIIPCACGCGQPVNYFQGKPYKFLNNHNKRKKLTEIPEDFQWYDKEKRILFKGEPFRLGFCKCVCGKQISIRTESGLLRRYEFNHQHMGKKGEKSYVWKGGRILVDGYWYLYMPEHPYATKDGYFLEHRKVMEDYLGRYLTPEEVVHHVDEDRQNNMIENLRLYQNHGKHIVMEHNPEVDKSDRKCCQCGSHETTFEMNASGKRYPKWLMNDDKNGFLCRYCYDNNRKLEKKKKKRGFG